jgi:hypothetical protein
MALICLSWRVSNNIFVKGGAIKVCIKLWKRFILCEFLKCFNHGAVNIKAVAALRQRA